MSTRDRVIQDALAHGWTVKPCGVEGTLLFLRKDAPAKCYLAQVMFKPGNRWDYALTFDRRSFNIFQSESETVIVSRLGDLLHHLEVAA